MEESIVQPVKVGSIQSTILSKQSNEMGFSTDIVNICSLEETDYSQLNRLLLVHTEGYEQNRMLISVNVGFDFLLYV